MAQIKDAVSAANKIFRTYENRRPEKIAKEMGILIVPAPFKTQKGAYKVIERQPIIFINDHLHPLYEKSYLATNLDIICYTDKKQYKQAASKSSIFSICAKIVWNMKPTFLQLNLSSPMTKSRNTFTEVMMSTKLQEQCGPTLTLWQSKWQNSIVKAAALESKNLEAIS